VLPQMILPVESLATFSAGMLFVTAVDDGVKTQLFLALEGFEAVTEIAGKNRNVGGVDAVGNEELTVFQGCAIACGE
jgi:hypothetical protein